jgi:hypothetical protein
MKYIFYCPTCGYFKKTAEKETIKCPLCKGKAEAKGEVSFMGGRSPNGIHNSNLKDLDE